MNHRIALEERTGVMKKAKDNVWKDLLGIIGAFLSVYGFFLVCVLILMAVTHTAWVTYDTNWLNVLKFMLIAPLVIMVLVASWLIASYIRTERLLKTFIETPAESPRMEEADTYLRALLSSGTLRERNYPKVREARTACFKDGRIVSRKIRDYCQILYDIDPEYAKKMISRIPVLTKHLHPLNIPAKQPPLLILLPLTLLLPARPAHTLTAYQAPATASSNTFYIPPSGNYEDDDSIALDMEEAIDDDIIFHGGNPFDWDTRSDYLDDPFGFGRDDGDGGEDW